MYYYHFKLVIYKIGAKMVGIEIDGLVKELDQYLLPIPRNLGVAWRWAKSGQLSFA